MPSRTKTFQCQISDRQQNCLATPELSLPSTTFKIPTWYLVSITRIYRDRKPQLPPMAVVNHATLSSLSSRSLHVRSKIGLSGCHCGRHTLRRPEWGARTSRPPRDSVAALSATHRKPPRHGGLGMEGAEKPSESSNHHRPGKTMPRSSCAVTVAKDLLYLVECR